MNNSKVLQNVRIIQKCIIVRGDGMILALKRPSDDKSRPGCWDLPGGGYEQGENVIKAIKREVQEEAGLLVRTMKPIYVANHIGVTEGFFAGLNVFGICYTCSDWEGLPAEAGAKEGEVTLSDEHTEYRWVTPAEFAKLSFGADNGFFGESIKAYITTPSISI